MGKSEKRKFNQIPDAIRILTELCEIEPNKPKEYNKVVVDFGLSLLDKTTDHDPADSCGLDIAKDEAKTMLADGIKHLADLQERLYAQDRWAVLLVFQAMDAAGKDGVIKHVMSGVNPQGCEVHPFKQPSAEELDHDFLWRVAMRLPRRGRIGIFNRSHYEEVLVTRVHPEILQRDGCRRSSSTRRSGSTGSR